jgi:hypothetical protein
MAVGETSILQETVTLSATATQFRGVQVTGAAVTAGGNGYPCATGGVSVGVSGDSVALVMLGVAIGEAGAAVALGALLEFNASGQFITRSAGVTVGRAMSAAGAAGDLFQVFVIPH